MRIRYLILLTLLIFSGCYSANATHLRAGEITITRQSCTSLTFTITITVYTNTGSQIRFGDGLLDFGDGSDPFTTPTVENTPRTDLGPDIGTVTYSTTHVYGGAGRYIISYIEPNRNAGILNMSQSVDTPFYMESGFTIDPFVGCDNSPRLLVPPIDKACTGAAWYHNPGAYDPDGDSLSYEFTIPKKNRGIPVDNYRDPNVKEFYDRIGINYGTANETADGPPTFTIDPLTGTIVWNSPGVSGEYNIAFVIRQWRQVVGIWINTGYVVRDMQIIVEDCRNKRPELQVPADLCVEAGTKINADIFATDPDNDPVKIEAFSQILNQGVNPPFPSPATYTPFPAVNQLTGPGHTAKLSFEWQTTCNHIKEQPYQVVFKVTDNPPVSRGAKLVQFKTWNIRVVGPAPVFKNPPVLIPYRTAKLEWNTYPCQTAEAMQVWRRVDSKPFTPAACVTGIPESLGFTKIAEVPITQTIYNDTNGGKGLSPGAKYCYRLVAVFPRPGGGDSYVSAETCMPPIPETAPIITHVTVDQTKTSGGKITVKWRAPFALPDTTIFRYKVFRAEGLSGILKLISPHTGTLVNTSYQDTDVNSEALSYNYRVVMFNASNQPTDTSSTASQVRLEAKPLFQEIRLTWNAVVPWSNKTDKFPYHYIYRGPEGATEAQLVKIDSIRSITGRFTYSDIGLDNNKRYCYRVMTQGVYGNPLIKEPFKNFSQIICAQPNDLEPPCKQELSIVATTCDQYYTSQPCSVQSFSNTVSWKKPLDPDCLLDIKTYNLYFAKQVGDEFTLLASGITDTVYVDSSLPSFARCYKVAAVDRAGQESELSESFCFDNCPHYELPNVFTPNGDNCNEKFSAFSDRAIIDEEGNGPCGVIDPVETRRRCARFVESVTFTVSNRWGKEVYTYQSGGEKNIYIDWDGKDNDGKDLSSGVYYYNAQVTFTVVDPNQKKKDIRGWVQIIR
ncbi:MAG: gliding motility-associated C-terminal domain-containing protein [Cyclobacteriaceae bacterium]|nr:gliding motility-associated C-terminal domain-containing protein [Cyclobacteriaceae bacterium]